MLALHFLNLSVVFCFPCVIFCCEHVKDKLSAESKLSGLKHVKMFTIELHYRLRKQVGMSGLIFFFLRTVWIYVFTISFELSALHIMYTKYLRQQKANLGVASVDSCFHWLKYFNVTLSVLYNISHITFKHLLHINKIYLKTSFTSHI